MHVSSVLIECLACTVAWQPLCDLSCANVHVLCNRHCLLYFVAPSTYTERSGSFSHVATSLANPHMLNEGKMSVFDYRVTYLLFCLLQVHHSNLNGPLKQ